ncbi:trans-aconitate 2-methyltransferase [Streptosporangium sp. NPDC020145]|uniref:trans-aconitate 2-methyltransferase n=1 Tax=Streptosporangium sp. NPDC020145 TaxID=3154694 RepID=UPI00342A73EF
MSRDIWNPRVYGRYADERSRPFFDLVARIAARSPRRVVDAGCGTGELTATLAERWPEAEVHGFDSSPAMLAGAPSGVPATGGLSFSVEDVTRWRPREPVDVIVSNAVLQWVPGHRDLLPRWVEALAPGGWLAFQVPGNFGAPSHALVHELCRTTWRDRLADLVRPDPVGEPAEYHDLLAGAGCRVDAWETTYLHVLTGEETVLGWITGSFLRPMLDRLSPEEADDFLHDCSDVLVRAYPRGPHGTLFPFRRIFVVAQKMTEK